MTGRVRWLRTLAPQPSTRFAVWRSWNPQERFLELATDPVPLNL